VFGEIRPASTMVEVSRLIDPEMMVEIEVEAMVDEGGASTAGPPSQTERDAWYKTGVLWGMISGGRPPRTGA
jgi:hypothetical protein